MLQPATDADVGFLRDCVLVEATFPNGTRPVTDAVDDDHIIRYIEDWGRDGDLGLVAWDGAHAVGAAWTRLFAPDRAGYGFIAADVPELTVAVVSDARAQGWGRALVAGILDLAAVHGHERVSLSVDDRRNPVAVGLYRSLGFTEVGRDGGGSLTMVTSARPDPPSGGAPARARAATVLDGPALLRLREVMLTDMGEGDHAIWWTPFLAAWAEGHAAGYLLASVVDGDGGRPIASAIASIHDDPRLPGPVPDHGLDALVSSVATEPAWRRRGAARACVVDLQHALVVRGVGRAHLRATSSGQRLYEDLGFREPSTTRLRWTSG